MLSKTVVIDGKSIRFGASAGIPRLYRHKFRRDLMKDLSILQAALEKRTKDEVPFDIPSLEVFENVAYTMAKYADPSIADTPEEWFDEFGVFSIYDILPEIIDLWVLNMETLVDAKKNLMTVIEKQGK